MDIADTWADHLRTRFPSVPSPHALRSRLLLPTMSSDECLAAVQLPGGRDELQVHRVRAGRGGAANAVAVCALRCDDARGEAELRLRDRGRVAAWWRRASLLERLLALCAAPFLLLALPGYLLIVSVFTLLKWQRGVRGFGRLLPTTLRAYTLEARSEDAARSALGAGVIDALSQTRHVGRFQVVPGLVVAERLLDGPTALDAFLADLGGWTR